MTTATATTYNEAEAIAAIDEFFYALEDAPMTTAAEITVNDMTWTLADDQRQLCEDMEAHYCPASCMAAGNCPGGKPCGCDIDAAGAGANYFDFFNRGVYQGPDCDGLGIYDLVNGRELVAGEYFASMDLGV